MKRNRILIIDHDRASIGELFDALLDEDFLVYHSAEARPGLEMLRTKSIDLLITEMIHQDFSGKELLFRVSQDFPDLPVILLTSRPKLGAPLYDEMDQVIALVEKPTPVPEVLRLIADAFSEVSEAAEE